MGKWIAGIAATVIGALIVWWVLGILDAPDPPLKVSAWYAPEPMEAGKAIDIFVKVLQEDDSPVPNAYVKLTPTTGTFTWAGSGTDPIEGITDQNGLFATTFQTVLLAGFIDAEEPPPANTQTGSISIFVSKAGYEDSNTDLEIVAKN